MSDPLKVDDWVYVVVQDPGKMETIIGQHDADHHVQFIPVFKDKESAAQGAARMARTSGSPFEVQAILFEDLLHYAGKVGFLLFLLDRDGRILFKAGPDGRPI